MVNMNTTQVDTKQIEYNNVYLVINSIRNKLLVLLSGIAFEYELTKIFNFFKQICINTQDKMISSKINTLLNVYVSIAEIGYERTARRKNISIKLHAAINDLNVYLENWKTDPLNV